MPRSDLRQVRAEFAAFLALRNETCYPVNDNMLHDVLQVFIWTFALGAALAIPMSVRKSAFLCIGWLALYGLAYWYLSMNGRYVQETATSSGRWMPMHCEKVVLEGSREVATLNGMGAFFAPLVWVDRMIIHRAKDPSTAAQLQGSPQAI